MAKIGESQIRMEERRRIAVHIYRITGSQAYTARLLGVTHSAVSQWLAAHRRNGTVDARPKVGRTPRLTEAQWKHIIQGTSGRGYTLEGVAHLIRAKFGVKFNPRYLERPLRKRGYVKN